MTTPGVHYREQRMTTEPQRYDEGWDGMEKSEDGDWVRYENVAFRLRPAEAGELDAAWAELRSAAQVVTSAAGRGHDTMASHDHAKCLPFAIEALAAALRSTP